MHLLFALATLPTAQQQKEAADTQDATLEDVLAPVLKTFQQTVEAFRDQPVSPTAALRFEQQLQLHARELARVTTEWTYNHLEPKDVKQLPHHVRFEACLHTRLSRKTPREIPTLFGKIILQRTGYRVTDKTPEPTLFPLERQLGLIEGATPALAQRAAAILAEAGMTQKRTLLRLRQEHGVNLGTKKLRQLAQAVSDAMAEQRQEAQVEKLLELLEQAADSRGRHKPVLAVGRDGITLPLRVFGGSIREVASTATVTVLDRRGRRLGTVYLAYQPESKQVALSKQLTQLLEEVLRRWQKALPRLCYVTDGGDNETTYYDKVLSRLKHPSTGVRLSWTRVLDYYHASERIWTMAELLFGSGQRSYGWARKMQRWLKKPAGVNRVLHSAAAYRDLCGLQGEKREEFTKAYAYLRRRMKYMDYAGYRRVGVPLGSGVTEAGCKTVYTQRLKLSGMRWQKSGAQVILNLRVLALSGVWDSAFQRMLTGLKGVTVWGQSPLGENQPKIPA
jgi:hypothetical protein